MVKRIKKITDLTPDTANVNRGTERGQSVIDWSLTELGAGRSIVADADGNVLAGNKTMKAAAKLKLPVRVVETDGKELVIVQRTDLRLEGDGPQREKARQLALADNRTQELSYEADIETLLMHAQTVDLGPLYRQDEIDAMIASLEPEDAAPGNGGDDFDTTPEETQTRVRKGDLWELGNHRLLCGDSTKAEDVARVMGSAKANLLLTDPPYNVAYVGKTKDALTIDNDSMSDLAFRQFLVDVFKVAFEYMEDGAGFYIWHADSEGYNFRGAIHDLGQQVRQCLVWVKNSLVLGRQDYHWRHEPCLYGWKAGASHHWHSDRSQTTVLEFDRPTSSQDHPTMKPVALFEYQVKNSAAPAEFVLDLFGGSGTTLIACERTNRKARVIEIEPKYCNVILSRWEAETGKEAKLLERVDG